MIDEIKNELGLDMSEINNFEVGGIRYFKATDVCDQVSLSNPSVAVGKVSPQNKRKFTVGEIENAGEIIQVRPWYVTEDGLLELLLLNNTDETQRIKERIATRILPRIVQLG